MNFFDHQDAAKRATRRLVVLFVLSLIGVGVLLYVLLCARYPFAVGWMGEVQGCAVLADVCILHIVYIITSSRIIIG